jgi:thiamine-monophosphate kinase
VHASVARKPETRPITAVPPAFAGSLDLPTRQSGASYSPLKVQNRTVSDLGERALIDRITARLAMPSWVVVGPGDDAAVIKAERGALQVLTTDALVEGVHFDHRFVPPNAIGHRALAVNLSDLAAMGATPRAVLLSLVLPDALDVSVVDGMLDGLLVLAATHGVSVIGGNISRSPGPLVVDVTAYGAVKPRRVLRRTGARPGDGVYVTGTIGEAAVGLHSLQEKCAAGLPGTPGGPQPFDTLRVAPSGVEGQGSVPHMSEQRYLYPEPRVRMGMLLGRNRAATACMDLSDGLADAIRQVAAASQVGIAIDAAALPIADEVRRWHKEKNADATAAVLQGGDDYELLFTARPSRAGRLRDVKRHCGNLPITKIGEVTRDRRLTVRTPAGETLLPEGFEHFR